MWELQNPLSVELSGVWVPVWCGWIVGPMLVEDVFREKKAGKMRTKASGVGERVAMVVPPRYEGILVLWATRAISWCRPTFCSCSGC